jgi:hypothetical protein
MSKNNRRKGDKVTNRVRQCLSMTLLIATNHRSSEKLEIVANYEVEMYS